jgi:hypothetical protein
MRAFSRAFWLLSCQLGCLGGCANPGELGSEDPKAPGQPLGLYALSGELTADDCGAESLNAPSEWSFEVRLSRDRSTLYWLNGREAIIGQIDDDGSFEFETHLDLRLAEQRGAAKGCTVRRSDAAAGTLTQADHALSMKLSYGYAATTGSDCSELVGIAAPTNHEGAPQALPCSMTYTLAGTRLAVE